MASPQPDKHVRISTELLQAIYCRRWTAQHLRILLWVIRHSYGWNRKWAPAVALRKIGEEIGMDYSDAGKAIRGMVRAGILKWENDRYYLIKDYEKWAVDGGDNTVDKSKNENPSVGEVPTPPWGKSPRFVGEVPTRINKEAIDNLKTKTPAQETRGADINLLITEFQIGLRNHLKEEPTAFNRGAAGRGFKKLLASYPRHEIQSRFNAWFTTTDEHIARRSWRVEDFFGYFNRLKDGPIAKAKDKWHKPMPSQAVKQAEHPTVPCDHCRRMPGYIFLRNRDSRGDTRTVACICANGSLRAKGLTRWNGEKIQSLSGTTFILDE